MIRYENLLTLSEECLRKGSSEEISGLQGLLDILGLAEVPRLKIDEKVTRLVDIVFVVKARALHGVVHLMST